MRRHLKLSEVAAADYGFTESATNDPTQPKFLRITDIDNGAVDWDSVPHAPMSANPRFSLAHGDVVVARTGASVGRAAWIGEPPPAQFASYLVRFRPRDNHMLSHRYLGFLLRSPLWHAYVDAVAHSGSAQPNLSASAMGEYVLSLPDLATQTAIADVLGALDDKIAANERVRRAVGELSSVLFASATRDSRTARLGDCAKLNERTLKPGSGSIRYLDISSVGVGEFAQPIEIAWSEAPGRARRGVQNGDIIWSTVRPERRSHALILDPPDDLVCSTGLITITPTRVGSAFLYEATRTQEFVDFLVAGSTGSAYPATNAAVFLEAPIPLPDATVLGEFEAQMGPAWRRAAVAAEESRRLAATRDALLPELMSGRLKMKGIAEGASE